LDVRRVPRRSLAKAGSVSDVFGLQTELVQFIRGEIKERGAQSFAWFMEQALYHPEHGYYSSGRATIGRRGDYFTNVSIGPVFGELLAAQFAEIWERVGKIDSFVIVEQGAHHGEFARDVLESLQRRFPESFSALRYLIVEPFSALQDRQSKTLQQFRDRVRWRKSLDELEPFVGIHFSNELLDSMPVHLLVATDAGWQEKCVSLDGDDFAFVRQPIVEAKLKEFAANAPHLPPGHETEIRLAARDWIEGVAAKLQCGFVLVFDYGFLRDDFYDPQLKNGTLQVRVRHRRLTSPFQDVGNADITAHANWTDLAEHAEQHGLQLTGFTDQHHFLTGIISKSPALIEKGDAKTKRALQTLLHPEMLGRTFQVLGLTKDVDLSAPLAGFKFARQPRHALGL
jgi:SAM-dependent MidA family methyltransferase